MSMLCKIASPARRLPGRQGPARQSGLSMVEMMVAITVSLILMAGVIQLLVGNKQAYRLQEGYARLNENARFARLDIARKLRMGDHWGGVEASDVSNDGSLPVVTNECSQAGWSSYASGGILGYEGGTGSPMTTCIPDANYADDTDVIVVRYAEADTVDTAAATTSPLDSEIYVRSAVGRRAMIVQGDDITGLPSDLYPDAPGIANYSYRLFAYFIRPCSAPGPDGICNTSDDAGDDTPTLVRLTLDGDGDELVQEDVAEGVEQLQAVYGENTDGDFAGTADRYVTADNVTDWGDVVSVRLSMVVRNPEMDVSAEDTRTYNMAGGDTFTPTGDETKHARRLFHHVVQIRNKSRS